MNKGEIENRLKEYLEALRSMETERWVAQFAENGTVQDPVGGPEYRGHDQLRDFFNANVRKNMTLLDMKSEFMVVVPPEAAMKYSTQCITTRDQRPTIQGISTYKFREDGKILDMRAYWDPKELAKQLKR